jgi:hypothetical protein
MQQRAGQASNSRRQRGATRLNLIIGGAILVVLLLLLGVWVASQIARPSSTSLRGVADRYITALFKGDIKATYAMHTDNYKKRLSQQDWNDLITAGFKDYKGTAPTFVKAEPVQDNYQAYNANADPQRVSYTTRVNNQNFTIYLILVTDGPTWKIDEMTSYQQ